MKPPVEITICVGSSCFARGNECNLAVIERYLREHDCENDADLRGSLCMGKCAEGPNMVMDGCLHHDLDEGTVIDLLRERFETPAGLATP